MRTLIDKTIQKIFVSKNGQDYLRFQTDEGNYDYYADGECCSESYFSDVNRIQNIIGQRVVDVEEVELMEEEITKIPSRQDEDQIYGFKIKTDKGVGLIVMRNSSNGYYGGSVNKSEVPNNEEMFEIVKDFCALDLVVEKNQQ